MQDEARFKELQGKVDALEKQAGDLAALINQHNDLLVKLNDSISEKQSVLDGLVNQQDTYNKVKISVDELRSKSDELRLSISKDEDYASSLNEEITSLTSKSLELKNTNYNLSLKASQIQSEIERLLEEKKNKAVLDESIKKSQDAREADLNDRQANIENEIDRRVKASVRQIVLELEVLKEDLDKKTAEADQKNLINSNLAKTLEQKEKDLTAREEAATLQEDAVKKLKTEIEARDIDSQKINDSLTAKAKALDDERNSFVDMKKGLADDRQQLTVDQLKLQSEIKRRGFHDLLANPSTI